MKKGINAWADYDRQGNWTLCIGKKRGKLSLDEIKQAAQAALKERRTLTNENPTPKTYNQAHVDLLEEIADVYVSLGELLSLADWETVAHIRAEEENRWMQRLEERNGLCTQRN